MTPVNKTPLWLDCDPGHDDVLAIILAAHSEDIRLLGISITHGNTSLSRATANALSVLTAINRVDVPVYAGAEKPLVRFPLHAPQIHGESGLNGTDLLPVPQSTLQPEKAINAMARAILECPPGNAVLCATGPVTNIANLISVYPEVADHLREIVIMGGAIGSGNISPVAEFNMAADPEAAQAVLQHPRLKGKIVIVPLELTHTAIASEEILERIKSNQSIFRKMLSELILFYAKTYAEIFGIVAGPPVHDPCTVAYVIARESFILEEMRVDVVTDHPKCFGQTVCDVWGYDKDCNAKLAMRMDVPRFWDLLLSAIDNADKFSLIN